MKSNQSLFKKIIPINNNDHLKLKICDVVNYSFAKTTNASVLTTAEFEKGSKIYPILFIRDGNDILPVALFGLEDKQNLFLKWNNQWDASYIPAHIRRYPFSLANADSISEFVVCIDEKATVLGSSGEFSLFLNNGKQSEYLSEKIRFLQELQIEYEKTLVFTRRIDELKLFEPMNATINLNNGDNLSISGFYTVNKEKFQQLDEHIYKELVINDDMKLIYEHYSSLDNFSKLIDVISERKVVSKKRSIKQKSEEHKTTTSSLNKRTKTKQKVRTPV
ncbi:MAG: SapC family protein [Gammaproteobacteria bacterium]|nr:SapC family protein [Gammaproteobacteria bacterium]